MLDATIYGQLRAAYDTLNGRLRHEGEETALPPIQLAHFPIDDTALAACLLTLGIPARDPAPYTDCADLDEAGNERGRHLRWWVGDSSPPTIEGDPKSAHLTEQLTVCWSLRARFEAQFPLHPMVAMRAAIDARTWWVLVLQAYKSGRASLPTEVPPGTAVYWTDSLHAAALLKAHGFTPLAFSRDGFAVAAVHGGVRALQLLQMAATQGQDAPQMMAHVLANYTHLLAIAKSQATIIASKHGDQTLLLTQDAGESAAGRRNRDKFRKLVS